ncbi:hypothetical protein DL98DRAFT_529137 [Cadophora sp. DSE1049]|nr:hypothetical protein DL98DRAFT_529137 [Cadophora sp. DSE1049]
MSLEALAFQFLNPGNIAEASDLLATLRLPGQNSDKWAAVKAYIERLDNRDWIWAEIEIYRMVGRTSAYLLDGEILAMDPAKSEDENDSLFRAIHDLEIGVQAWCYLAVEGALGHFLMYDDVHAVKRRGGSAAELLRAFIRTQKLQTWDEKNLFDLCMLIYRAAEDFRRVKKERVSPDSEEQRRPDSVALRDGATAIQRESLSSRRQTASTSLKRALPSSEESTSSKRPQPSDTESVEPPNNAHANPGIDQDSPVRDDDDLYGASPPPRPNS